MRLTRKRVVAATASSTIATRCVGTGSWRVRLVGRLAPRGRTGRPPGRAPRAPARRPSRWPRWMGSKVPPRMPHGRAASAVAQAHSVAAPLQLVGSDAHRVARLDAGPDERPLDAQLAQLALEPLRRFLVLEVGLGDQPLDAPAAHPEHVVGVVVDAEGRSGRPRGDGPRRPPAHRAATAPPRRAAAAPASPSSSVMPSPSCAPRRPRPRARPPSGRARTRRAPRRHPAGPACWPRPGSSCPAAAGRAPPARRG